MYNALAHIFRRNLFSWLFEVLPVALLVIQSAGAHQVCSLPLLFPCTHTCVRVLFYSHTVAVVHRGNLDGGRSFQSPFAGVGQHAGKLSKLLGAWKLEKFENLDQFLSELRFPAWKRALAARAGQQYVLNLKGGHSDKIDDATLQIVTSDVRGTSTQELPLSGQPVKARDGDGGAEVSRSARPLDDKTVEITETLTQESKPYSVCTRTLTDDGKMILEVKKRTPNGRWALMRAIASRINDKAAQQLSA